MEITFEKKEYPCMKAAVREIQNAEQTQELRLPDGMPDVGKVLCTWGQVILRSKEWRSDSVQISGGMLVWVLYLPEDGTQPCILDGWIPFQMRWTLPENCAEGDIRVIPLTRFADARSISPRKLMLRAGTGILTEVWVPYKTEAWQTAANTEHLELLHRHYPVRLPREAGEKTFSAEEDISSGAAPGKLLYCTLRPEIVEQKVIANKIAFRGNGNLHTAWITEDGAVSSMDYPLPFSQFAELRGSYSGDAQVDAACCVTNLETELTQTGSFRIRYTASVQYLVDDLSILEPVEDAYAPGMSLQIETQVQEIPAILEKKTETIFSEASLAVDGIQIGDVSFLPDFARQFREGDGITLEIPGTIQVLGRGEDGTLCSTSCRWEGKLCWPCGADTVLTAVTQAPPKPQLSMGAGSTAIRAELPLQLTTSGGQGIPMVTAVELGENIEPDPMRPSLILRRAGGDSLWEIAKKCGSTMEAIRSANNLQEEPRPNQMLLIPVC